MVFTYYPKLENVAELLHAVDLWTLLFAGNESRDIQRVGFRSSGFRVQGGSFVFWVQGGCRESLLGLGFWVLARGRSVV